MTAVRVAGFNVENADLLDANRALLKQNHKLRDQLAVLLGQQRATP